MARRLDARDPLPRSARRAASSAALAAWMSIAGASPLADASEPAPPHAPAPAAPAPAPSSPAEQPATQSGAPAAQASKPTRSRRVLREGSFLTNRRGRLVREGRDWVIEFDRDARGAAEPPMIVQPGQRLMEMQRLVESRAEALTFVVSGEVFVYRDRNYLLPLSFVVARGHETLAKTEPADRAEAPAPQPKSDAAPKTEPVARTGEPTPEDLLQRMEQASAPERAAGRDRPRPDEEQMEATHTPGLRREGEFLNLRKARITRTAGGEWRASLDNDPAGEPGANQAAQSADVPLTLLGCQTLQRIESLAERSPNGLTITLSGQVFTYEGENFLLPTMFVVEYADVTDLRPGQ